jgi:hypothetical protein
MPPAVAGAVRKLWAAEIRDASGAPVFAASR